MRLTRYQRTALTALRASQDPTQPMWCMACQCAGSVPRVSNARAYCSMCSQPTLINVTDHFEEIQPALTELLQMLATLESTS